MDFQPPTSTAPPAAPLPVVGPSVRPSDGGDLLAIGFGTTVAMWGVGYVGHMPLTDLPPLVFLSLMLLCLVAGGWVAGRWTARGIGGPIGIGLISAALNLLILGSLLLKPHSNQLVPGAWLWVPGTFALSVALVCLGALVGRHGRREPVAEVNWAAAFAWITAVAALLLIAIGGLVSGFRAGMAVPDWPNSYGSNMFLFPFTLMSGSVFYEHAHRLLGSLTGMATLVLAIYLTARMPRRKDVLTVAWLLGAAVAVQGVLGGFRVTRNSAELAVAHGFFAHAILGGLVALAVLVANRWTSREGFECRVGAELDRSLTMLTTALVLLQTLLGVLVRQLNILLLTHITVATLVALAAMAAAMRAWGLNPTLAILRRAGVLLMWLLLLQIVLGIVSVVYRTPSVDKSPSADQLQSHPHAVVTDTLPGLITTTHQTNAALMLAVAVLLTLWTWRLLQESPETPAEAAFSPLPLRERGRG